SSRLRGKGLIIESDSAFAVSWCKKKDDRPWKLWGIVTQWLTLLPKMGSIGLCCLMRGGSMHLCNVILSCWNIFGVTLMFQGSSFDYYITWLGLLGREGSSCWSIDSSDGAWFYKNRQRCDV
ncbi:hypothetical protein Gohar_015502, partial [Gossypium harknessii]|nr:hypothetical protein [Gossypium harknessii]